MLRSGAEAGSLRSDVDPEDVTMMLVGLFLSTTAIDAPDKTEPLLDLIVDTPPSSRGAGNARRWHVKHDAHPGGPGCSGRRATPTKTRPTPTGSRSGRGCERIRNLMTSTG
ncbi:hypothetical protein [Streptomyces canus]|uniref:hypothetical protein n=1 Tax=Streptomyces canus TaxID=58343 RepID=UPI003869C8F0